MTGQEEEPTGNAKITKAYNLPCRYILHTVGPIISEAVTQADRELLASCYRTCLELAAETGLGSIAFCCISTGEFHFPNELAAEIAIQTVGECLQRQNPEKIKVIFNVFKDSDYEIYKRLLRYDIARLKQELDTADAVGDRRRFRAFHFRGVYLYRQTLSEIFR